MPKHTFIETAVRLHSLNFSFTSDLFNLVPTVHTRRSSNSVPAQQWIIERSDMKFVSWKKKIRLSY